jgi:hypothetical protein
MIRTFPLLVVAILSAPLHCFADTEATKKLEVPSDDLPQSLQNVKSIFGDQYAKARAIRDDDERRAALAGLVKQIIEIHDSTTVAADQYALLQVAEQVAVQGQDFKAALAIIEKVDRKFRIDALVRKSSALFKISSKLTATTDHSAIVPSFKSVMDATARADRFDLATKLAELALDSASKSRDKKLLALLQERVDAIKHAAAEFAKYQAALEQLEKSPSDPNANLAAGKYLCIYKGDWENGQTYLALGADEQLKQAAGAELVASAPNAKPDAQIAVADRWWKLAEAATERAQTAFRQRAAQWYRKALPSLTEGGLARRRVELRLSQIDRVAANTTDEPMDDPLDAPLDEPEFGKIPKFAQKFIGQYIYVATGRKSKQTVNKIWEFDLDFQVKENNLSIGTWKVAEGTRLTVTPTAEDDEPFHVTPRAKSANGTRTASGESWRWELTRLVAKRWQQTTEPLRVFGRSYGGSTEVVTIYSNGRVNDPFGSIMWKGQGNKITIQWDNSKTTELMIGGGGTTYTGKTTQNTGFRRTKVTQNVTGKLIPPGQQPAINTRPEVPGGEFPRAEGGFNPEAGGFPRGAEE